MHSSTKLWTLTDLLLLVFLLLDVFLSGSLIELALPVIVIGGRQHCCLHLLLITAPAIAAAKATGVPCAALLVCHTWELLPLPEVILRAASMSAAERKRWQIAIQVLAARGQLGGGEADAGGDLPQVVVLVAAPPVPAILVPCTVDDPLLFVDPIEALVEEAGKLVAKWYTVAVIKAALAAALESKGGGAGEDDQAQSCLHIGDQHQLDSAQPRCHASQGQKVSHPSIYSLVEVNQAIK